MASAPQSQPQPLSSDEEALKKNTDCVYFLASPLTCKKGSECEYRHSDAARLNPRDCWYWLHGNCLNPKCAFRHPPLDGLLGTQAPAFDLSSDPIPHHVTMGAPLAPNSTAKQGVPCVFFQKGHCLKGDWCQFLHVSSSSSSKVLPVPGTASTAELTTTKPGPSVPQKNVPDKKVLPAAASAKPVSNTLVKKATSVAEPVPSSNENATNVSFGMKDFGGYRARQQISNGNAVGLSGHSQQSHLLDEPQSLNGKDVEEVSREPSPGFDVLVDDEGRDSDYFAGEDRYGMPREHDSRNEFDIGHSTDYNIIAGIDDERYHDSLGYDRYEQQKGLPVWDQHQISNGGISGAPYYERRPYNRAGSFAQIDELDLRHRLSKPKKPNGLRSVISHDFQAGEFGNPAVLDNSVSSSRLRGRIRLPRRSPSPVNMNLSRGTDHGRLSSSFQRRPRERMKSLIEEPFTIDEKNGGIFHTRRDASLMEEWTDFAGPKSLSELKSKQIIAPSGQSLSDRQSMGKRKSLAFDGLLQQGSSDPSFEGPKSLQEILKRKRGESNGPASGMISANDEGMVEDKILEGPKDASDTETKAIPASSEKRVVESGFMPKSDADNLHAEGGLDPEPEIYEQREGEDYVYYQEEGGEEEVVPYEDENQDAAAKGGDYAYDEEEDDDDEFAKKMGVMYS